MIDGILGKKIGMTHIFDSEGNVAPVSVLQVGPCYVVQKKSVNTDGYSAIQVGFDEKKQKSCNKPDAGRFLKANVTPKRFVKELAVDEKTLEGLNPGDKIEAATILKDIKYVDIIGTSKGIGFAGVMKRHNFSGSDDSHGTHEYRRHGGSIGQHTYPSRTFKNLRMPGHCGNSRVTVLNLKIAGFIGEDTLLVKGAVPGANGSYLIVKKARIDSKIA